MDATNATDPGDFHRRMPEERLRDREFRAEDERVYAEMFEQLAPATEGAGRESGSEAPWPAHLRRRRQVVARTAALP
jgi:hypothetical protein